MPDKDKSPLDYKDWPSEGGSYTRAKDGSLSVKHKPTEAAEPSAMSQGSAQAEQEKREQGAAHDKAKAKHK